MTARVFSRRTIASAATTLACMVAVSACAEDSTAAYDDPDAPIKVGAMAPVNNQIYPLPEVEAALEQAVALINADGGISGRDVELEFCDTKYDPNLEVKCARELVSAGVSAVVYPYATLGVENVYKTFESKGIPVIGNIGVQPADITSEVAFPLSSGVVGWWYGAAAVLIAKGATNISIISIPSKVAEYGRELAAEALTDAGLEQHEPAIGEINTPDWSGVVAKALQNDPDGVLVGNTPVDAPRTIAALRSAGYQGEISTISTLMSEEAVQALGPDGNGVHVVSLIDFYSNTNNPAIVEYQEAMLAVDAKISEYSLQAWSAMQLFAQVLQDVDDFSPASVLETFSNMSDPVDIGTTAPYSVKSADTPDGYDRMFNPTVAVGTIQDGTFVAEGGYRNPFELVEDSD